MVITEGQLISDGTAVWKVKKIGSEVPAGTMQMFAGNTIPEGWLLCDGSAISRTDYADLFAVIGTTWGAGDGSTTFNLPNSIGRFAEGAATSGSYKSAGLPNIEGYFQVAGNRGAFQVAKEAMKLTNPGQEKWSFPLPSADENFLYKQAHIGVDFSAKYYNTIYGNSTTVQPNSFTVRYIIKY